jgi:drug/metabolite transporter (DMT)-like permease
MMIVRELAAVVFGLASALSWGAGDFSGGLASKRAPLFGVILLGHGIGLALVVVMALLWREPLPAGADLGWGAVAGISGVAGLAALYRGLAVGRMGVVAPVSALVTAALPVLFGALIEGLPGRLKLAGFALALVGIWLIAGTGDAADGRDGLGMALLAGAGFGAFFILIHQGSTTATFWPLAAARVASVMLILSVVLLRRRAWAPPRLTVPLVLLSGTLDVGGNAFFVLAGQAGRLDVAAVLSSMYPASTVLLATLLLGERMTRAHAVGVLAVLAAIALIAA